MSKGIFLVEIPCERLVRNICGSQWRTLSKPEIDAAWGIALVRSALDGARIDLVSLSNYLGVERLLLSDAYDRLRLNGKLLPRYLESDRTALLSDNQLAWGYIGGIAAGATGLSSV